MPKEIKFAIKITLICIIISILSIPTMKGWGLAFALKFFSYPLSLILDMLSHTFVGFLDYDYLFLLVPICNVFIMAYLLAKIINFLKKKLNYDN